ncbi:MAG TPA: choice-of-anchor tandem repeat GloVer-containing protein [Rhizomicrobium sp.]|jgi:uncharacterized repeat protein (TIGR03803 family)
MPHSYGTQPTQTLLICALLAAASTSTLHAAPGAGFRVLHSFCKKPGCTDGGPSTGGVIADDAGNLFGASDDGGASGLGVVFELAEQNGGDKFSYARLHNFCTGNCKDGSAPEFPLIRDQAGNLYGTTASGGAAGGGVVFELMPGAGRWTLNVLHKFCAPDSGTCKEGASPSAGLAYQGGAAGLPYDGHSPLFGTTAAGGALNGGAVFALMLENGKWRARSLHDFCPPPSCAGGSRPLGGLLLDSGGNIFGVTNLGGAHDEGAVFELSPAGSKYDYTVIYDFCSQQNCIDGVEPAGGLALDVSGNLYGTTSRLGTHDAGTLFELSPDHGKFDFQVLHQFCDAVNCTDGGAPSASLTLDENGNIFGTTTQFGNTTGGGTLFELSPSDSGWTDTVLYGFCSETNCADGTFPKSHVILDQAGNLFGTTEAGGSTGAGVVFEFRP